jgi:hypothetical protein
MAGNCTASHTTTHAAAHMLIMVTAIAANLPVLGL